MGQESEHSLAESSASGSQKDAIKVSAGGRVFSESLTEEGTASKLNLWLLARFSSSQGVELQFPSGC